MTQKCFLNIQIQLPASFELHITEVSLSDSTINVMLRMWDSQYNADYQTNMQLKIIIVSLSKKNKKIFFILLQFS